MAQVVVTNEPPPADYFLSKTQLALIAMGKETPQEWVDVREKSERLRKDRQDDPHKGRAAVAKAVGTKGTAPPVKTRRDPDVCSPHESELEARAIKHTGTGTSTS